METGDKLNRIELEQRQLINNRYSDIDFSDALEQVANIEKCQPHNYDIFRLSTKDISPVVDELSVTYRRPDSLAYDADDHQVAYGLSATIKSRPEAVNQHRSWSSVYLANLRARLADDEDQQIFDVRQVEHDVDAIYVPISGARYARVGAIADYSNCDINVDIVDVSKGDGSLPVRSELDDQAALHKFLKTYGTALDCFVECFGEDDDKQAHPLIMGSRAEHGSYQGQNNVLGTEATRLVASFDSPEVVESEAIYSSIDPRENYEEKQAARPTRFEDIGGLFQVKNRLRQIANSLSDPESAAMYGISQTHFILHGAPGTGKTSLVEAFAYEADADINRILVTDVSGKYIGDSAKNIDQIFDNSIDLSLETEQPVVIFMDEIDALIGNQADGSNPTEAKRELLMRMNDLTENHPGVIVAGATNSDLDKLDKAFLRSGRFEQLGIGLPTMPERQDIWTVLISRTAEKLSPHWKQQNTKLYKEYQLDDQQQLAGGYDIDQLAEITEDWSGADMAKALEAARAICRDRYLQTGQHTQLTNQILLQAVRDFRLP